MEESDDYKDNFENWIDDPDYFEGIDCDNEVDLPSLNKKQTSALFLNLLNTSEDLGVNEAKKLIILWKIKLLAVNLSKFDWLDVEVANKLIEKKYIVAGTTALAKYFNYDDIDYLKEYYAK